ncbi:hypothetical protein XANCAGTX0491_008941 [Xanthoria calcicola]
MDKADVPYWRVNVPKEQWPAECPEFLLDLSERDKQLVDRWDQDYHRLSWPEVKKAIGIVSCLTHVFFGLPSKRTTNSTASSECHRIIGGTSNTTPK